MARLVTLTTLQTRVGQRAGMRFASNAAIIESGELTDDINEGIAELYELIASVEDQNFYHSSTTFQTTANTDTYAIGAGQPINITDFYKAMGRDVQFGQNIVITERPFMWSERNRYKWYPGWIYSQPVFGRLVGNAVQFVPTPGGQFNITMHYIPTPPTLVNGSDTFDGVAGWEEYAVLHAAIQLLSKQEQLEHAAYLEGRLEKMRDRVLGMAGNRETQNPERVQDVTLNDGWIGRPGY